MVILIVVWFAVQLTRPLCRCSLASCSAMLKVLDVDSDGIARLGMIRLHWRVEISWSLYILGFRRPVQPMLILILRLGLDVLA